MALRSAKLTLFSPLHGSISHKILFVIIQFHYWAASKVVIFNKNNSKKKKKDVVAWINLIDLQKGQILLSFRVCR